MGWLLFHKGDGRQEALGPLLLLWTLRLCLKGHLFQGPPAHPAPALGPSLAQWLEARLTQGHAFIALSMHLSFTTEKKLGVHLSEVLYMRSESPVHQLRCCLPERALPLSWASAPEWSYVFLLLEPALCIHDGE